MTHAQQEVGDAPDAVVDQRHLVHHVTAVVGEHIPDTGCLRGEGLPALGLRDAPHPQALPLVLGKPGVLVRQALSASSRANELIPVTGEDRRPSSTWCRSDR
ncbi:MAG: hypothetical protein M3P31_02720 [Actinomycetota bacterium]|nr:hypothetical protein [Actinomycetota bacterium]